MSNFHLEVKTISRGKGKSITRAISYIGRMKLYDCYKSEPCSYFKNDLQYFKIYLPSNAPPEFGNPQVLCNEIDKAEERYDARTARTFICSLPNELPINVLIEIVNEFVQENFINKELCAVAAIHEGKNKNDPTKNNPHVHIIVSTRTVEATGFNKKKDREHNNKKYMFIWRESWAKVQNRAYERNGMNTRVNHESLEVQGELDREPVPHLSQRDFQKEQRGERTVAGDRKRAIQKKIRKRHSSVSVNKNVLWKWNCLVNCPLVFIN